MSVTNFRKASLKNNLPKSSDFADITFVPPPADIIIQTGLIRNYDAQSLSSYPGSGTTWTDLMGSGYNATLTNGPTYTSGTPNYITTDGSNDRIVAVDTGMPTGSQNRTIGAWVYPISNGDAVYDLIGYGLNAGIGSAWFGGAMINEASRRPRPNFSANTYGPWMPSSLSGSAMTINAWNFVQVTYSSSYAFQFITNDGTAANSYVTGSFTTMNTVLGASGFYVGWQGGSGLVAFNARYGQYFAYNTVLSKTDLILNYTNTKAKYGL